MPHIHYRERASRSQAAVFAIALREGADGINFPAVAAELGTSLSSLRRWVRTADRLPRLGIDHVNYRRRCRLQERAPGELPVTEHWHHVFNLLLRALPFDDERRDDEQVWNVLVGGFGEAPWAVSARTERDEYLAEVVRLVIAGQQDVDADFEERRLAVLVHGVTAAAVDGLIDPADTTDLIKRHVTGLSAARHLGEHRGAA